MNTRIPILPGTEIFLNNISFYIDYSQVAEGSTCLVYKIHSQELTQFIEEKVFFSGHSTRGTILKEFYPTLDNSHKVIRDMNSHALRIPSALKQNAQFQKKHSQFMRNLHVQKQLSSFDRLVAPIIMEGAIGDSYYYVITNTKGSTYAEISKSAAYTSLQAILSRYLYLLDLFEQLHKYGYIMLDIKPDNIMFNDNYRSALIVDADSLVRYNSEDLDTDQLYFTNMKYAAPEIKRLRILQESDPRIISKLLTPYADMYSLALILFELLWDKSFSEEELIGKDSLHLLETFCNKFYQHPENRSTYHHIYQIGKSLLEILNRLLIPDLFSRSQICYSSVSEFKNDILKLYDSLDSDNDNLDILTWYKEKKSFLEKMQQQELFAHHKYMALSNLAKATEDKAILLRIADEKLERYHFMKSKNPAHEDLSISKLKLFQYQLLIKTIAKSQIIRQMIKEELEMQSLYEKHLHLFEDGVRFFKENREHELLLRNLLS